MSAVRLSTPKVSNRFRVLFQTVVGILDEPSKALSLNLLAVSKFSENDNSFGIVLGDDVIFTFKDDVEDTVYEGIQTLKNSPELQIDLQYLDCNEKILRQFRFEEPNIGMVEYSALDYGASGQLIIKMPVSYSRLTKVKT
jgi:hypothetical protein